MADEREEAKVVTYVLELPLLLPVPNDYQMAPLIPRTAAWAGWTGNDFWKLLEWPGSKSIPDHLMPGPQIRFRRVSVRSAPPLRAADEAFADKVRPLLNRREKLARWWGLRRADHGIEFMKSVVSFSVFVAPAEIPDHDTEQELDWFRNQFYGCLAELNRFLTGLSMAAADWRVGRLGAGQLPPLLPIVVDHLRPGDSPGRWPIHLLVSIRPDAPELKTTEEPPPDFAWRATAMMKGANHGIEPYLDFFAQVEDAWAYSLLGESTRCVITLGTAVEVLVSTTIREGGARLEWPAEETSTGSAAWLQKQVTVWLARLLDKKIDIKDRSGAWGEWWSSAYRMRNEAVHNGRQITQVETVAAKKATARVLRELKSDLGRNEALSDLSKALKIDFTDADHDYRWRMIRVLPFSLRRLQKAEAALSWEP
jgi:hypothetical protein